MNHTFVFVQSHKSPSTFPSAKILVINFWRVTHRSPCELGFEPSNVSCIIISNANAFVTASLRFIPFHQLGHVSPFLSICCLIARYILTICCSCFSISAVVISLLYLNTTIALGNGAEFVEFPNFNRPLIKRISLAFMM